VQFNLAENESARLAALRSFGILDTPPEQAFDDLVRLAGYICGTPIALIGFMDAERLWFKSRIGWDINEVPREKCFCAHTVLQSDVLVVPDTLVDNARMAECALASHGGIRFYAGAPLLSSEGYCLGTVSVMGMISRGLSQGQVEALRRISRVVVQLLENRREAFQPFDKIDTRLVRGTQEPPKVLGLSFWKEITEQRRSREALRQSEQRLHGIIESAMDAIITVDCDQRIRVFNQAAEQTFRCTASQAVGQSIDIFIPERFRASHQRHVQEYAKTGITPRSMGVPARLLARRYDGQEFTIEATISKAEINGQPLCTVILRDLSTRLRLEAEARQAQRIEAVEQLAGGVAHQFNNYLGIILGYSDLLSEEAGINERLCRYVAEIIFATQNAALLTTQLLAFGRKQVPVPRVLNLNTWLGESESMLRQLVSAHVEVAFDLAPKVGSIHADPAQIQQMLANLLVNARDAMPNGGKATITTADVEFDEACANQSRGVHPGSYVSLAITDTGHGMSADTREHLFEPFYTTQGVGKGAGLGLAAVFGIVKDSGGHISVETCEGGAQHFAFFSRGFRNRWRNRH